MTSTLEKLLLRFCCASAETCRCRRSGEDDCAQNAEDSILQFCELPALATMSVVHPRMRQPGSPSCAPRAPRGGVIRRETTYHTITIDRSGVSKLCIRLRMPSPL